MRNRRLTLQALASAAAVSAFPNSVFAQAAGDFPSKPVRYIVPFAAGGQTDVMARLIGQHTGIEFKQPITVDNRAGASGNLGADLAAKSPPDVQPGKKPHGGCTPGQQPLGAGGQREQPGQKPGRIFGPSPCQAPERRLQRQRNPPTFGPGTAGPDRQTGSHAHPLQRRCALAERPAGQPN